MDKKGGVYLSFLISIAIIMNIAVIFDDNFVSDAKAKTLRELNREVETSKQRIEGLSNDMVTYQSKINETKLEIDSLEKELDNLDKNIEVTDRVINDTVYRIEAKKKSIQKTSKDMVKQEIEIEKQKKILKEIIQEMYTASEIGETDLLELVLYSEDFQEALNDVEYLDVLHNQGKKSIDTIESVKKELQYKRYLLEDENENLNKLLSSLAQSRVALKTHEDAKTLLLEETQGKEENYIALKEEAKLAQQAVYDDISRIQDDIKKEKERLAKLEKIKLGDSSLLWPVDNYRITTYFHDPTYPFIYLLGQHQGLDLAAPLGTTMRAAHGGIVTVGYMKNGYGKYMLITSPTQDGKMITTLYGHMKTIYVNAGDEVKAGQAIGEVGSTGFSTGPHVHFELRVDNIPVNPLLYL